MNQESLRKLSNVIKSGFSKFIIGFSWVLFLATFIWVVFAAIVWPAQNAKHFRSLYPLDDNYSLEVWGPTIVPGESSVVEIRFTLHQKAISNTPLLLSMTIPQEYILESPANNQYTHNVELNFNGNFTDETQTIQIANAQIISGLKIAEREIPVYLGKDKDEDNIAGEISIGVEPTLRAALRQYGGGGNEIPLFPLTTLFISVAGLVYREFQQRKLDEEKKEEKLQALAKAHLEKLRQALKNGEMDLASQVLHEISRTAIKQYSDETQLHIAQRLINVAFGNIGNVVSEPFPANWLDEAAAALLYAVVHHPSDRQRLDSMLREFPLTRVAKDDTRTKLETAKSVMGVKTPVQDREPLYPPSFPLPKYSNPIAGLGENPFPCEKAEDDIPFLFAQSNATFWSDHPLLKTLKTAHGATLVSGEAGSGKTAFALALGEYRYVADERTVFSCYFSGTPRAEEIRNALAGRLLSFIERQPTFLVLLNDEQRNLLAQTLVAELGKDNVSGRLGYISNPARWVEWLNKAGDDSTKRNIWKAETLSHLKLLQDCVVATTPHALTEHQWLIAFMTCIYSLEFEKSAYIIIDTGDEFAWDWYNETIKLHQHKWKDVNLHTITFYPPQKHLPMNRGNDWLKMLDLKWTKEQLLAIAQWRWESAYERPPFASIFDTNALELLLELSEQNPRCFIRLWNAIFRDRPEIPIKESAVRKAKEQTQCN